MPPFHFLMVARWGRVAGALCSRALFSLTYIEERVLIENDSRGGRVRGRRSVNDFDERLKIYESEQSGSLVAENAGGRPEGFPRDGGAKRQARVFRPQGVSRKKTPREAGHRSPLPEAATEGASVASGDAE